MSSFTYVRVRTIPVVSVSGPRFNGTDAHRRDAACSWRRSSGCVPRTAKSSNRVPFYAGGHYTNAQALLNLNETRSNHLSKNKIPI